MESQIGLIPIGQTFSFSWTPHILEIGGFVDVAHISRLGTADIDHIGLAHPLKVDYALPTDILKVFGRSSDVSCRFEVEHRFFIGKII